LKGLSTYIINSCNCSNIILHSWASHWLQCNICWSNKHLSIILYDAYFISSWFGKYVLVIKRLMDSFAKERSSKERSNILHLLYTCIFHSLVHDIVQFIIVVRMWKVSYTCEWPNIFLNGQILTEGHTSKYFFFLILNSDGVLQLAMHLCLALQLPGLQITWLTS